MFAVSAEGELSCCAWPLAGPTALYSINKAMQIRKRAYLLCVVGFIICYVWVNFFQNEVFELCSELLNVTSLNVEIVEKNKLYIITQQNIKEVCRADREEVSIS